MKKQITITITMPADRNNFHGAGPITLRVCPDNYFNDCNGNLLYPLSPNQYRKIAKHFCGMADCCCGSGPQFVYNYNEFCVAVACFDQK
jgi:hypothetical protein